MSLLPHSEPTCDGVARDGVELVINGRKRDLAAGFMVQRVLPVAQRRMVGPFIFFDHMGPVQLAAGDGLDVLPHPHIELATVTYLFEGELLHRDSLGSEQLITPGAVTWMMAGRGIVHSERTPVAARKGGAALHGMQLWVALPEAHEQDAPWLSHHPAADIPELERDGTQLRVLAGSAFGVTSPVRTLSALFYAEARLAAGSTLELPAAAERAAYVVSGDVTCDGVTYGAGTMLVFRETAAARLSARDSALVMALGGAPVGGERYIDWNFVSSSKERIERAKRAWRDRRFPSVPGDDQEFVPLPQRASK